MGAGPGLLERDQAIADLLAAVERPAGAVVLLTDEAGIGKTSVIRSFLGQIPAGARTYVVRRLDRIRLLLVLSYRPDAVRPSLRALLGDVRGQNADRVELAPLSLAAVEVLARRSSHDADELHLLTKGNPFYLTETLAGPAGDIPVTVVDAVLARLGSLSEPCRQLVEQRGVLILQSGGIGFRHEIARRATEQQLPEIRRRSLNATVWLMP